MLDERIAEYANNLSRTEESFRFYLAAKDEYEKLKNDVSYDSALERFAIEIASAEYNLKTIFDEETGEIWETTTINQIEKLFRLNSYMSKSEDRIRKMYDKAVEEEKTDKPIKDPLLS